MVRQDHPESTSVNDVMITLLNHGRLFSIPVRFSDVDNNESVFLFIRNPHGSDFDYTVLIEARASGLCDLDVSFDATEDVAGTDVQARNMKSLSTRSTKAITRETQTDDTGSYTHGQFIDQDILPDSTSSIVKSYTIDEGDEKLFEMNNVSGTTLTRMAISATIAEVNGEFIEVPQFT